MQLTYDEFSSRVAKITSQIAAACAQAGRDPSEVELLAVTKTHPATAAEYAARYGLRAVGENRVQEAVPKRAECEASIAWELIGHLQSNKAKLAAEHFDRIQSVDTIRDTLTSQFGHPLPVLSMGMSGDLEIAIAAGSTQVRVGTALFGQREGSGNGKEFEANGLLSGLPLLPFRFRL